MAQAGLGVKVGDRAEFQKTVTQEDIAHFAEVTGEAVVLLDPVPQ